MVIRRGHGLGDWMWQRLTAGTMAVYSVVVLIYWLVSPPTGFDGWKAWCSPMPFRIFSLLFFWALMYHAWLGVREIMMDYVHHQVLRLRLEWLVRLALLIYALWATWIVWSI
ncbi:MAG: succinate dehydrogenase, hydrophobic membrane anchor protein [Methylophilaceae bacterium]|nr:succinate dehydrogenase, hydrophobic membrane anchor protein [Methyloradius sp.]